MLKIKSLRVAVNFSLKKFFKYAHTLKFGSVVNNVNNDDDDNGFGFGYGYGYDFGKNKFPGGIYRKIAALFFIVSLILIAYAPFEAWTARAAGAERSVKYILIKVIDADSGRAVNSAAININRRAFFSTSPSGMVKVDIGSKELAGFDFLDIQATREGYFDESLEISIKDPSKVPQPVKIKMKQKMGTLTGKITGCWSDREGHYFDAYSNEEISVFGKAVSSQHIIYKFRSDQHGNFKIFNLPVGTYEIDIRHKKWTVEVSRQGEEIIREFSVRKCNRAEYHKNEDGAGDEKKEGAGKTGTDKSR